MSFTVSANTPLLGYISWNNVHIVYDGVDYAIQDGETNKRFASWKKATPDALVFSDVHPVLTEDDCIVFLNKGGVPISVLTASSTDGDLVVPGTITSAAIATGAIDAEHIKSDAITARHILAGSIVAEKMAVNELSAISANLGTMAAGNFTLDADGFIKGGAANYSSGNGFWMGYHQGAYKFRAGAPGSSMMEWNGEAFNIYGPDGGLTISSGVVDYTKIPNHPTSLADINGGEGRKLDGVEDGATRNVFRGDWVAGKTYVVGDVVIDSTGNGWSALKPHVADSTNAPPGYPQFNYNNYWTIYAIKGEDAVVGLLTNEAHTVPTDSAGNNGNFTGAATTMMVYNGATDDSANWTVAATPIAGVTGSLVGKTYTVTAMTVDTGYVDMTASRAGYSSVTKRFTLTKSKAGVTGAPGPAVVITPNRPASFTATDGNLDASQADITYTAAISGITSPTYVWTFSGLQTNPTASTSNTQTITAAQFGNSKAATITCTVNGSYKDAETIVRLEKSTAAPYATSGSNLVKKSTFSDGSAGGWNADAVNAGGYGGVGELLCAKRDTLEIGNDFPVTPGETLFFASDIWTGASSYPATVGVRVSNSAGTIIAYLSAPALPAGQGWTRISGKGVMPAGAARATPWLLIDDPNWTTLPYVAFSKIYVGRQQEGATVGADGSNLQSGRGINLLYNAGMTLSLDGFNYYGGRVGLNLSRWCIRDTGSRYGTVYIEAGAETTGGAFFIHDNRVPVVPGRRYEAYAYTGAHRCDCNITIDYWDSSGNNLGVGSGISYVNGGANNEEAWGGTALAGYKQIGVFSTAPPGAVTARFVLWKGGTKGGQAGSYLFATMPYIGEATSGQTELSPWAEGSSAINTQITSGNASTYIANAAIGAAQIGSIALVGTSNFSVKTGVSGARMEMDSRAIKVFDASGVKRVQLGDLTV